MKRWHCVAILLVTGAMLVTLVLLRAEQAESSYTPEVRAAAEALEAVETVEAAEPQTVEYKLYYTAADAEMIAKTVWGEARGCTPEEQAKVVWCILNRVDDPRFPDTIQGVITQPHQFHGYDPTYPVTDELLAITYNVLCRWNIERQGVAVVRELPSSFLWFTGDGEMNYFREVY